MRHLLAAALLVAATPSFGAEVYESDYFLSHGRITFSRFGDAAPSTVASTREFAKHFPIGHQDWKCSGHLVAEGSSRFFAVRCPGYGDPKVPIRFVFLERSKDELELAAMQRGDLVLDRDVMESFARAPFATYATLQRLLYDPAMPVLLAGAEPMLRLGRLPDAADRLRRIGFDCAMTPAADDADVGLSCSHRDDAAEPRSFDYVLRVEWGHRFVLTTGYVRTAGGGRKAFTEEELRIHAARWFSPG